MLLRLCQLKTPALFTLTLLFLGSCSLNDQRRQKKPSELQATFPTGWFKVNPAHSLIGGPKDEALPHLLIDVAPDLKLEEKLVTVVIATPEGSQHSYSIDPLSGQRYFNHSFCKQNDIWSAYNGSINRPVFSVGLVPKILDQLGEPQRVIIWSGREHFHQHALLKEHRVRLVGAYVEQTCPEGNCLGKNNWLSRLVFIAVDPEDEVFSAVNSIESFMKTVKWEKAKATLENMDGQNFIGDKTYPSKKVGNLISIDEASEFFKKNSIILKDSELMKVQKSCHALYDKLWADVGQERPEDRPALTRELSDAKHKLVTQLKREKKPVGFAARLKRFTQKYYREFSTCEKFVYHGNFNLEPEKFWFLAYMDIYFRLHKEGYYFDCVSKTWQKNILSKDGGPVHDIKRDGEACGEKELDQAMSYLPNFLTGLKGEKEYFRFIDYDTHSFGSHKKMYSWVKVKSGRFDCRKDPNIEIRTKTKLFPEDVSWKERYSQDYTEIEKIIR